MRSKEHHDPAYARSDVQQPRVVMADADTRQVISFRKEVGAEFPAAMPLREKKNALFEGMAREVVHLFFCIFISCYYRFYRSASLYLFKSNACRPFAIVSVLIPVGFQSRESYILALVIRLPFNHLLTKYIM